MSTLQNQFDVIITTYNREESLKILVENILEQTLLPENIIVVDSSPKKNITIKNFDKVKYIISSHGNQPYQRYLGKKMSESEILIFMDDDMRILQKNAFEKILERYNDKYIVGVQPNFTNANEFLQEKLSKSKLNIGSKKIFNILKTFTGYHIPSDGKLSFCGVRGKKPKNKGCVEYFNGGVFSVKRDAIFTEKFNYYLFTIFEEKLGMGEDTLLGYEVSKYGKISYLAESMFLHDDQKDSSYSVDILSYANRVSYSRLYLSFEYSRLNGGSKLISFLHYNWYMLWRIIGLLINVSLSLKNKSRKNMLVGYLQGWSKAIVKVNHLSQEKKDKYWERELLNDIKA